MPGFKAKKRTNHTIRKIIGYWYNTVKNLSWYGCDKDVFDPVERYLGSDAVARFIRETFPGEELRRWEEGGDLSDGTRLIWSRDASYLLACVWNNSTGDWKRCKQLFRKIRDALLRRFPADSEESSAAVRMREFARVLRLSETEAAVAEFLYVKSHTCFAYPGPPDPASIPEYVAMALDRPIEEVSAAMAPDARLRRFCVLDGDWDFNNISFGDYLAGTQKSAFESRFYRKADLSNPLPWDYFGDLAERHGKVLETLLSSGKENLNILLYGAPGTGKTSFARSLAVKAGRPAFEVAQGADRFGRERSLTPEGRLSGILLCNDQNEGSGAIMIVDEADRLLRDSAGGLLGMVVGGSDTGTDKGVINSVLDGIRMPTIWISNLSAESMDEAVRRRFDYSVRFDRLSAPQREAIWHNTVERDGLRDLVPESSIPALAAKYAVSAGGIANVLGNLRSLASNPVSAETAIDGLMKQHCELLGTRSEGKDLPAKDYSLEGLNLKAPFGLDRIEECVRNHDRDLASGLSVDRPRLNLLLWGPPGCGKTEFVKYLGLKTGRRVIVKKGSDLLGRYVGQNEANIRNAFREAEAAHAILFFDEIDGILRDRAAADRSWEVTMVNELLQQMERFDGVFVAATNFFSALDTAVLRRFTFKLEFDFLDPAGKKIFFERFFSTKLTPSEERSLAEIPNLCPGDFRTVRQSLFYLGDSVGNAERIAALRTESSLKRESVRRAPLGFCQVA